MNQEITKSVLISMKIKNFLFQLYNHAIEYRCCLCGSIITRPAGDYPLCGECVSSITLIPDNRRCEKCGKPLISEKEICTQCRESGHGFVSNYPLFSYLEMAKELIYQYKFNNIKPLAAFYAEKVHDIYKKKFDAIPIIPVPGSKISVKKRGWDQIDEIVKLLNKRYGIPVLRILKKDGRKQQKHFNQQERKEKIKNTILLNHGKGEEQIPETVLVLDDVYTTGATVNECAGILQKGGVQNVYTMTLTIG